LKGGADAQWRTSDGDSAIENACSRRHLSTVEILLNQDKDLLEIEGSCAITPLLIAIAVVYAVLYGQIRMNLYVYLCMHSIWQQRGGYNHKTEELARTSSYITLKEAVDVSLAAIMNGYSPEFV
jgi:hypothetical protein